VKLRQHDGSCSKPQGSRQSVLTPDHLNRKLELPRFGGQRLCYAARDLDNPSSKSMGDW
jgi:hypothetical protein